MTLPSISEDHYISTSQRITLDVLNTSIQSVNEDNNNHENQEELSEVSSNLTTVSLNSSSESVRELSRKVSGLVVQESLHEIDVVDGPLRIEEQRRIDLVVQDTINTSLRIGFLIFLVFLFYTLFEEFQSK